MFLLGEKVQTHKPDTFQVNKKDPIKVGSIPAGKFIKVHAIDIQLSFVYNTHSP